MAASTELGAVSATGNPYLDTLILGDRYVDGPVTYYFDDGGNNGTADDWTDWGKDALRDVFDTYSDYIPLDFVEVGSAQDANFILRLNTMEEMDGAIGRFGFPDADEQAYGTFAYDWGRWSEEHVQKGGYGYHTILHEVGHGLGLGHPHDSGNLAGGPFPGVSGAGDQGDHNLNNGIHTVMSYIDHSQPWAPTPAGSDYGWGFAGTPMAFDITALQEIYGTRSKNPGNTVYNLPDVNGDGTYWESIYDTGGTDVIRYTGNLDANIDLRPAHYGIGEGAGGYLSNVVGVAGGYTIAHGTGFGAVNRIENGQGGSGDDTITGNEAENVLEGFGGHDSLVGGNGDDTLVGGSGNDTMNGGGHFDDYHGGSGNDTYYVGWQDQVFEAPGAGTDRVFTGLSYALTVNVENLFLTGNGHIDGTGNAEDNVISGTNGNNVLEGLAGDDTVNGNGGHDDIDGGTGNDSLMGGLGNDLIDGGSDDVVQLGFAQSNAQGGPGQRLATREAAPAGPVAGVDKVLSNGGGGGGGGNFMFGFADTLDGGQGNDTLIGRGGNDHLFGDWHEDSLVGGSGSDTLDGGFGADIMEGGSGSDTYYVDHFGDVVVESAGAGNPDHVLSSVGFALGANVENLSLTGTNNASGVGNALDNDIIGNGGNNLLQGLGGDDFLSGGNGADSLEGGADDDTLFGGNGNDELAGGDGHDSLEGGSGEDEMDGGAGSDTMNGGTGGDTMLGGSGADAIAGEAGDDMIDAGTGNDVATGGAGADTMAGGNGEDWLGGGGDDDSIDGGAHSDALFGAEGNDTLIGGTGVDFLTGGADDDSLIGGDGGDAYIFETAFGEDTIETFGAGDELWFVGFGSELDSFLDVLWRTSYSNGTTTIDLTDVNGGLIHIETFDGNILSPGDLQFFA